MFYYLFSYELKLTSLDLEPSPDSYPLNLKESLDPYRHKDLDPEHWRPHTLICVHVTTCQHYAYHIIHHTLQR